MRSPSMPPHTCRRRCLSAAVSSSTVLMPASCRRASMEAFRCRTDRARSDACSACGSSACSITVRPSGLRISDAVFARKSFGAMPIEQRIAPPGAASETSCLTCAAIASAMARCRWRPTSSHATSSMEPTRAIGYGAIDRLDQPMVPVHVALRSCDPNLDARTQPPRVAHQACRCRRRRPWPRSWRQSGWWFQRRPAPRPPDDRAAIRPRAVPPRRSNC